MFSLLQMSVSGIVAAQIEVAYGLDGQPAVRMTIRADVSAERTEWVHLLIEGENARLVLDAGRGDVIFATGVPEATVYAGSDTRLHYKFRILVSNIQLIYMEES